MRNERDIEIVPNPNIVYVVMEQSRRSRVLDRLKVIAVTLVASVPIWDGVRTLIGR